MRHTTFKATRTLRAARLGLLTATALTLGATAAHAYNGDPAYFQYDSGMTMVTEPSGGLSGGSGVTLNTSAAVGVSFEGVSQYDLRRILGFSFIPPDTMGAVGATQFMETTNGVYAIYSKTGALQSMVRGDDFWAAAGGAPNLNGDARVMYDTRSSRWIVESFGASLDTIQIAVSNTSDALGPWQSTSFTGFAGGIADYPTLAIDSKAVYIGTNNFSGATGNPFQGVTLNVIKRSDLFGAGAPVTTSLKQFVTPLSAIFGGADPGFAIQGVNNGDGHIIAVSIQTSDLIRYNVAHPGTAGATLTDLAGNPLDPNHPTYLGTQPYGANNPGAQPGDAAIGGPVIDTLDDRISGSAWEQNGKIYAVHTVTPIGAVHTAVVWTVSDAATGHLIQEGTISGGGYDYYQGSLAVNASGQVVIGYDRSGSNAGDGLISVFAQTFNPLLGGNGALVGTGTFLLHVSNTDQYHNGSVDHQPAVGRQRWGDYSAVTVDPDNIENFWVIGEFAREFNDAENGHPGGSGGSRWGTWITELTLSAVPEPAAWSMMLVGFGLVGGALRRRVAKTA